MRFLKNVLFAAAAAAAAAGAAGAAADEEKMKMNELPTPCVTVEGITEYRLPNGLKVVLYPDAAKPTATVNMTYLVGSRQENYGETGMAHLLEHLMFKGSKNYPNPTAEFTRRGFRMNGSTWLDRTNYFVSFTATDDNMKWALGWQADAMVNSFIAQKDLDTEMTVVRNEYEMGENKPLSVMMKRMQSVMFDWQSYGRSTIGARSDIENVEIANLQAFYHRYYQPDNAVLTVSGKFDEKKVLGWIAESFGPIPKPTRTLPKEWTVEPTADGEREFFIRRKGEAQLVAVGYRIPSALSDDYEPTAMAADILADAPTGRLYKALVETGMASQVFGWPIAAQKPGFVMFGALVKKGDDIEAVKTKLVDEIENAFARSPVTAEELNRQKVDQETMFERTLSDPEEFGVDISDYIGLGDWRLFFVDRETVKAVTAEQVDRAAAKYFVRDNRVVGLFVPTDDPKRAEIAPAPSAEEVVSRYTFSAKGAEVEAFDASQDNIDRRTKLVNVKGVKMALLPKQTRGGTVVVKMRFNVGDNASLARSTLPLLASAMITRGTKTMTRDQIEDAFTALKIEGTPFSFTTDREHLVPALKLMGELFTESTYPQKEFDTLLQQTIAGFKARSDEPSTKGRDAISAHFNTYPKGDARYRELLTEITADLEKTTLSDVKGYYDRVFGLEKGEIAVVGDFDVDEVVKALEADIVDRKHAAVPFERVVSEYRPVAPARFVIDTPDKENAMLFARVDLPANLADADMPALITADWIIGGSDGLSNRIVNRLRQKEGLSYGSGSSITIPSFGNRAKWSVGAIVAPHNLAQAEKSLKDELAKAFRDGITAEELAEAKKGLIESRAVNRAQDGLVASNWVNNLERGCTWKFSKETEEAIEKLTVEDVNKALRRFCDPTKLTFALAGDVKKARDAGKDFTKE
ncbi:M16 family metallopeptidase [Sutterella sp.]|uniref:M16 family metallopeptidase n=1 Tax=Sutterella sp. TaxID=1981025 RepID=UPI003FD842F5